jgi:hypothetical protein
MKRLHFKIRINAPLSKVYDVMLGISNKSTYEQWTALFNPTSTYEGSWNKGSKILFIGIDENGKKGGMVSEIAENIPNRFVSIRHYGIIKEDKEVTEGPEVEKWTGGYENYSFEENDSSVAVRVDVDTSEDFEDYMTQTYPRALVRLKEICEQ